LLFHSLDFAVFFAATWVITMLVAPAWRKVPLLLASVYAYGCWNWAYLPIVLATALLDYSLGRAICATENPGRRRLWLVLSLCYNVGLLVLFKYGALVYDVVRRLLPGTPVPSLPEEVPVGISFFTFQSMAYMISVYRKVYAPARNVWDYILYVSLFPQMMAGPIERPGGLLRQLERPLHIEPGSFRIGASRFVWGLFQKLVIADNLGLAVGGLFARPDEVSGASLLAAVLLFAAQLYTDFAGYCDMALGLAAMLGIRLSENFQAPYLARSVPDFWFRWNRTLMQWFRDYVYRPLAGTGAGLRAAAVGMLVFVLSGLWHGAAWHFAVWGALNGFLLLARRFYQRLGAEPPGWPLDWLLTVPPILLTLVFFRAPNLSSAVLICERVATLAPGRELTWIGLPWEAFVGLVMLGVVDLWKEPRAFPVWFAGRTAGVRVVFLLLWCLGILLLGAKAGVRFLYLEF
jgi:alginate O-acetyltransferase complex protein AlgI